MRALIALILLSVSAFAAPLKKPIVLDAGHGGYDEGTRVQSVLEKKIALTTALLTKKHLEELGYRVILTRTRDVYLPLQRRVTIANKTQGMLFVSIHFNAAKNTAAKGIEVYYYDSKEQTRRVRTQASKRLATNVLFHLLQETQARSRGVKTASHHVTRETKMPAIMVEGGFITNREERLLLKDRDYLDQIAQGIAVGIHKFVSS